MGRSGVFGPGSDQAIVGVLLQDVSRPSRDPANGEDRRELIGRKAHDGVGRSRVEVDVGENSLLFSHHADHRVQDVDLGGVPGLLAELGRQPTPEEVAEEMSVQPEKIHQIVQAAQRTISLETPIGSEDETSLGDLIADAIRARTC